jgi:hypothetical protein
MLGARVRAVRQLEDDQSGDILDAGTIGLVLNKRIGHPTLYTVRFEGQAVDEAWLVHYDGSAFDDIRPADPPTPPEPQP